MRSFSQPGRLCSNYRVYRCGTRQELGEEKIITACLNIDIHSHTHQTRHHKPTQHLPLLNTINTIYLHSAVLSLRITTLTSYSIAKVSWSPTCGGPWQGFNLFFLHLLFVLSDVGGVGHSVKSQSQLYLLFTRERGGGLVVSPSIGESQLTKLTR